MRVLVTGGAGFIGSHLVERLLKAGHDVLVIDDMSLGKAENLPTHPKLFKWSVDLRNQGTAGTLVYDFAPEIVFHLAANAAENKAQFSPIDIFTRNYNTFLNVLVPAINAGMKRIVVTSSIAAYGAIQTPFKETDRPHPEDIYGLAKFSMEETLKILSKVHEFEYVITRPHNVYGPKQSFTDPYRNVIALWMNSMLKGKPYVIYGSGGQKRCYTYIDDLADGLFKCGFENVANQIFNLGADEAYTLKELSDTLQEVTGGTLPPIHLADRPQEVKIAIEDHSKAKELLGYKTTVDLKEGLKRTWEYAKRIGPQELVYTEIEIPSDKMPKNWRKP